MADARVDVWHASPEGFYENQDPTQAQMNLRGTFGTDAAGHIAFRTVKPAGYPVPVTDRWAICCARKVATTGRRTCTS